MKKILKELFLKKVINNEKGSMLILSLMIASVFVVFGAGYLGLIAVEAKNVERTHRSNVAMHIAESGVEEAIWEIKHNNSSFSTGDGWIESTGGNVKTYTKTLSSFLTSASEDLGFFTVMVTDPDGVTPEDPNLPPIIQTTGTAIYQGTTFSESRTIEVTLAYPATYNYAVFADKNISMDSDTCTDAYDSSAGAYDGPHGKSNESNVAPFDNYVTEQQVTDGASGGAIGTNSTSASSIDMDSNAKVYGNAVVGAGGTPGPPTIINLSTSEIKGTETALTSSVSMPSITTPTGLTNKSDISLTGTQTLEITGSGQYGNITLDGDSILEISGNTTLYLTNTLDLKSNAELVIKNGAKVEIYVDNVISFDSNSLVNNESQDPSMLSLFGTDSMVDDGSPGNEKIHFNSKAIVHATVMTKNATVWLDSDTEIFGAVQANNIRMDSNACIHYDTSLNSSDISESDATVALWQER